LAVLFAIDVTLVGDDQLPTPKEGVRHEQQGKQPELLTTDRYRFSFDQDEVLIGRSGAVDIRLPHPAVSLVHARLLVDEETGELTICDLASANGTRLGAHQLKAGIKKPLRIDDRLRIGPYQLERKAPPTASQTPLTQKEDTAAFARRMVLDAMGGDPAAALQLRVLSGPTQRDRLAVEPDQSIVVGRGEDCELALPDADASRRHARITRYGDQLQIEDLQSKNGVQLVTTDKSEPIADHAFVRHGDVIQVGNTRIGVFDPTVALLGALEQPGEQSLEDTPQELLSSGGAGREQLLALLQRSERPSDGVDDEGTSSQAAPPTMARDPDAEDVSIASSLSQETAEDPIETEKAPAFPSSTRSDTMILYGVGGLLVALILGVVLYLVL
jgi:pSer/pThr/pTyr-binding forkhead associated (FHA) protein